MSQNLNVLCVSLGSNCFCIISSYLVATKWSQFRVPSHGQLAVSGTVTLSCRAWSREGSQGLALVKSELRAGCAWLCCQSHLAPGWDKARPWPLLAVLQCGERGECVSPPSGVPSSGLSSGSGTAANHYTSITRSQALTRLSQSLPPQATGNTSPAHPSHETPGYVLIVAYYPLSLLGIFWFREITLYCPRVKVWTCFGDRICLL